MKKFKKEQLDKFTVLLTESQSNLANIRVSDKVINIKHPAINSSNSSHLPLQ
jgi:hypothetical protein